MKKRKAINLRHIAMLLIMFGLGLIAGMDIPPMFQVLFIIVSMIWFLAYDYVIESGWRKVKSNGN